MVLPTISWDENSPAGNTDFSLGDNRIREMKTQIREVMEVDHNFPSTGQDAEAGHHTQVHLTEKADIGTGASGKPIIGAQTISGVPELVYTTEDNVDIQITKTGKLYSGNMSTDLLNIIYPVGIVITLGVATNPATLFGIGTWTAIAGKVIIGIDGAQTEFDTLDETGGSKTVTLTAAQSGIPAHTHPCTMRNSNGGGTAGFQESGSSPAGSGDQNTRENTATDAASSHDNMPPYITKYVWQRAV